MDRQAEALITERIRAARPGDAILGEEGGETHGVAQAAGGSADPADAVRWIVDPLDGTVNYLYGLADWSVSIAAEVRRHDRGRCGGRARCTARRSWPSAAGARGCGATRACTAQLGKPGPPLFPGPPGPPGPPGTTGALLPGPRCTGATWDRTGETGAAGETGETGAARLRCNRDVPLARALVGTGFGYLPGRRRVQGEVVSALLPRIRDIRRGGSASVDLCMVAAGRLDAFYERGLNYWDYAAGALIAEEAGAVVTGLNGRPPGPSMTVAAAPGLHAELIAALAPLDPERDA